MSDVDVPAHEPRGRRQTTGARPRGPGRLRRFRARRCSPKARCSAQDEADHRGCGRARDAVPLLHQGPHQSSAAGRSDTSGTHGSDLGRGRDAGRWPPLRILRSRLATIDAGREPAGVRLQGYSASQELRMGRTGRPRSAATAAARDRLAGPAVGSGAGQDSTPGIDFRGGFPAGQLAEIASSTPPATTTGEGRAAWGVR